MNKCLLISFCLMSFSSLILTTEIPETCVKNSSSVDALIICLQNFIAKENSLTSDKEWNSTVPTDEQRNAWKQLIVEILQSNSNCDRLEIPNSLKGIYQLSLFKDILTTYCVLYETNVTDGRFLKGWGIFISRYDKNDVKINVHISAAHPFTDSYVQNQAANVFAKTYAASVLISGMERSASMVNSSCEPSDGYRSDGAHDNNTMFHSANYAIMTYQQSEGCKTTCGFIQFHGKANSTCPSDTIFLSDGFGTSQSSLNFYNNSNLPIMRLKTFLRFNMPNFTINTPLESTCDLTAGSNIFSRLLNGVPYGRECAIEPEATNQTKGYFIHAEQAIVARGSSYYDAWSLSTLQTFYEESHSKAIPLKHDMIFVLCVSCLFALFS